MKCPCCKKTIKLKQAANMGGYFQVYCPECGSGWTVTETSKEFNVVSDGYENGFDQKATVQVNDKLITE